MTELGDGDILIETFSVEHPATWLDAQKMEHGGERDMGKTWTNMLWDLAQRSGGSIVYGTDTSLSGTALSHEQAIGRLQLVR